MISRSQLIKTPMMALMAVIGFTLNTYSQVQIGQDIDGEAANDQSGYSVSMPDQFTVAIGAWANDGNGTDAGHVRVYMWNGTSWIQKGMDINGEAGGDRSGWSVCMPDSNTVAIGAYLNGWGLLDAGHVRVYEWNGTTWVQKGIDINGETGGDYSGYSVSMPDANTVAIGAPYNAGNGTNAGHVRIHVWNGTNWVQKGIDINGESAEDRSGTSLHMPDFNTVAIGAFGNDGNGSYAGHVRIYEWNGTAWVQKGMDIDGEAADDWSGLPVSMPDANVVAIGAYRNDGNGSQAGHVRVYAWNGTSWGQKGIDIDGEAAGDRSGWSVSMPDSNTLAIGAQSNSGNGAYAGQVRIYSWDGSVWVQKGIDIDGETAGDNSGWSVSMPDGNAVAIGAISNDANGTNAGHVRVYDLCPTIEMDIIAACNSHTWIDGINYTSSTNIPTWTLTNALGCDSIIILDLTINEPNSGIDMQTGCNSLTWIDGITYTSSTNIPTWTLTNSQGCDSVVTLDLTINQSNTGIDTQTACDSYLWIDGNTYMTSNNTATHTLINAAGCDSVVTLDLTINTISDVSSTLTDITVTANNSAASYIWLDCDDNYAPISGEIAQSYTPISNGNYAVELSENGCVDTSACVAVTTVGIIENSMTTDFVLFPNPTSGEVKIEFENVQQEVNVSIFSISGQLLKQKIFQNSAEIMVEIEGPTGVYLLKLNSNDKEATIRVVKE